MTPEPRPRAPLSRACDLLGREKERRRLVEATRRSDPSGLQVWGPRRIGKTWLLDWLLLEWQANGQDGPLHVPIRCQALGEPTPLGFYRAAFDAIRRASREYGELLASPNPADADTAGIRLIEFVQDLRGYDQGLVLLIDEFDKLARAPACDSGFLGQLRCIEQEANAALVVTTSLPLADVCREDLRSSPLFNTLPLLQVGPFSQEESEKALTIWKGTLERGFATECFAQSGGWPMVLALIARELDVASLEAAQRVAGFLVDELHGDLRHLVDAAESRAPGAGAAFQRLCETDGAELAPRHRRELERAGAVRPGGGPKSVASWRCAPAIVRSWAVPDRLKPLADGEPLTWDEWRRLAAAAATRLPEAARDYKALTRILAAATPLAALHDARHLCVALMETVAQRVPPAAIDGDRQAVRFADRGTKGARLAHLRKLCAGDATSRAFDPVLLWQLSQLDGGGNVGSHDAGLVLTAAEIGPLLMVAVEAVGRAVGVGYAS